MLCVIESARQVCRITRFFSLRIIVNACFHTLQFWKRGKPWSHQVRIEVTKEDRPTAQNLEIGINVVSR